MFNSELERDIERLRSRLESAEAKIYRLERNTTLFADKYPEGGISGMGRFQEVSIKDAMNAVLSHCGITLNYEPPQNGNIIVEKKKK